jgi:hypothetical protein
MDRQGRRPWAVWEHAPGTLGPRRAVAAAAPSTDSTTLTASTTLTGLTSPDRDLAPALSVPGAAR